MPSVSMREAGGCFSRNWGFCNHDRVRGKRWLIWVQVHGFTFGKTGLSGAQMCPPPLLTVGSGWNCNIVLTLGGALCNGNNNH